MELQMRSTSQESMAGNQEAQALVSCRCSRSLDSKRNSKVQDMMRFMAHFEKSISESGERQEKTKVQGTFHVQLRLSCLALLPPIVCRLTCMR